ncbi:biotin/lipoyl-binding protein [Paenibacillus sp. HB172176]|uniref:efflux RND transporter periplasmic adaptor subunit n=1 Tax=Paenibacillus sp. HB172176 TaxID=2493690 RepID=UPI00143C7105|nr:biotin/lipoyl-binding protein [Paenibacillus sp. HB172176]
MLRCPKSIIRILLASLLLGAVAGCSLLPSEEEALKPPLVKPQQESYQTVAVKRGVITQDVKGNGALESYYSERLQFKTSGGRIQEVLVRGGDEVKKGDTLVQLNVDNLDIDLKQSEIAMLRSKLALRQSTQAGDSETLKIAQLQYEIDKIKYDRMLAAYNDKKLVAGMDGQITYITDREEGDVVESYETLVVISDTSKLRFAFSAENAMNSGSVEIGQAVQLTFGDEEITGKVVQTPRSAPYSDNPDEQKRGGSTIFIEPDQLPKDAAIGTRGDVLVRLLERDDVLIIPKSGLRSYLGREFVRIQDEDGSIREADVEVGIKGSTETEITKGVEEGELIVMP